MEGNKASGVADTADHICRVLDKTLQDIGVENFAAVVSDNARNTRAACELIEHKYPWIIALQYACHLLNHATKEIGQLEYFQPCISKLKTIITHFHTSAYAARHLAALQILYQVAKGLASTGLTRFANYYYASLSTLLCLSLICELLSSGVLDLKPSSPIYWMLDRIEVQRFEEELKQLVSVLEPLARDIKCLELSHSTLSNVYVFWLAILAQFQSMFKDSNWLNGEGLPSLAIADIISILNGRQPEMFWDFTRSAYLTAFFLNIHKLQGVRHIYTLLGALISSRLEWSA
ncbi:hypothetical protein FRC09_008778 [Ceratobasidium sp. 395]|nr:hypothetical protein FRC09_008778 [Ceratobasidium sp. 395]